MNFRRRDIVRGSAVVLATMASGLRPTELLAQAKPSLIPVRGVCAAPGLSFSALFIAKAKGLWAQNGVDYSMKLAPGGAPTFAALGSGEADFACISSADPVVAWDKGIKTVAVAAFTTGLAMQFTARNDWLEKNRVASNSPIEQKVQALKNARVGTGTIGGGPAQYTRYLGSLYGLDGARDIKLVSAGLGAARIAALRENQIDVIVGSSPEADEVELQGFGSLFIDCANEVPAFKEFPYTVLIVTAEMIEKNLDMVRGLARSVGQANSFIVSQFSQAIEIVQKEFPKINPRAIERSMQRDKATFQNDGRMTKAMWDNAMQVAQNMKVLKNFPPTVEGEFWTNKFLG